MWKRVAVLLAFALGLGLLTVGGTGTTATARRPRPITYKSGVLVVDGPSQVVVYVANTAAATRNVTFEVYDYFDEVEIGDQGGLGATASIPPNGLAERAYHCTDDISCSWLVKVRGLPGVTPRLYYVALPNIPHFIDPGGWSTR